MFAVSISLGYSSAYVAVAPVAPASVSSLRSLTKGPAITVVANSAGHRNTRPMCSFGDTKEVLFGDTAYATYARQPGKFIPSVFTYAAVENALQSAETPEEKEKANNFFSVATASSGVKYKGHLSFASGEECESEKGFKHEYQDNGNDITRMLSATSLLVDFLDHIKEHSIDGPCSINSGEKAKKIFLTIAAPRYAFPSSNGSEEPWSWILKAVNTSNLGSVAAHVKFLYSDEAVLLGMDAALMMSSTPTYSPFLLTSAPSGEVSPKGESAMENILVVDWGAQGLHVTFHRSINKMLLKSSKEEQLFSTSFAADVFQPCGGDAIDVTLASRLAAHFIIQQRRMFSSCASKLMGHRKETLGKVNPLVAENIPAKALRNLCVKAEDRKVSLLGNPQVHTVSVEVEAFYEGIDLLDGQTLNRRKVEGALTDEWDLVSLFKEHIRSFLERLKAMEELSDEGVHRVILCGGMYQTLSFVIALENAIKNMIESEGKFAKNVEVLSPCRNTNFSSTEIFAVGGCLESYIMGTIKSNLDKAESAAKGAEKSKIKQLAKREVRDIFRNCWEINNSEMKRDSGKLKENIINYLQRNIYIYSKDDTTLLGGNAKSDHIDLPREALHVLFAKNTEFPSRVVLSWPDTSTSVVLFLLTDADSSCGAESDLVRCVSLSTSGQCLQKPKVRESYSTSIVITALFDPNPLLRICVVSHKSDVEVLTITPGNIVKSYDVPIVV